MTKRLCVYRKIYEEHYGPIPTDQYGNTYHIHHINGDCTDNQIENLIALSVENHYKLHLEQGDYGAAAILANELGINSSELRRQAVAKQLAEGRHSSQRAESIAKHKETKRKRFESGDNPYATPKFKQQQSERRTALNLALAAQNMHPSQSADFKKNMSKRIKAAAEAGSLYSQSPEGKQDLKKRTSEMVANGTHASQRVYNCPYCGKIGKGNPMLRYHMDACKYKS